MSRVATFASEHYQKRKNRNRVVSLISGGADIEQIAAASADAAEHGLERASLDEGLAHAFWLLTQVLQAARQAGSRTIVGTGPHRAIKRSHSFRDCCAFTRAVDGHVREPGKRTDLGEMAQHAAAETLASLAGRELPSLFGPTATDVQQALTKLGTSDRFTSLRAISFRV